MTAWGVPADKPALSEVEWAVSRRTSVENKDTRLRFAHYVHNPFQKENNQFRIGVWSSAVGGRTAEGAGVRESIDMPRSDEMDGQSRQCETAAAFESTEPMGSERHEWQGRGLTPEGREHCVRSHNWSKQ
jgi:hypothetical protein